MLTPELREAIKDLRYILNRGYNRASGVEFVSNHYCLELQQRHLLARCVFSKKEIIEHKEKLINLREIQDKRLSIDGYNVLITVESILDRGQIIKCDDGFIRDLQAVFGKYRMSDATEEALNKILKTLEESKPREIIFYYDKQVSRSGELAGITRSKINYSELNGNAKTTVGTDADIRDHEIAASSDRAIIKKTKSVLDIPAHILKTEKVSFIDLTKI